MKGERLSLSAADGHVLEAYRVTSELAHKRPLIVIQEIFGVNGHIRDVCDRYAQAGYDVIAPALFDRVRRDVELGYDENGIAEGRELAAAIGWDWPTMDIWAAATHLAPHGRVAIVGYCWGASWVWRACQQLELAGGICYYGRHIVEFLDEQPKCPVLLHFGALDASIPMANVERIQKANPGLTCHVYPGAGHGFNCDQRPDFHPNSAELALNRTYRFLEEHLG